MKLTKIGLVGVLIMPFLYAMKAQAEISVSTVNITPAAVLSTASYRPILPDSLSDSAEIFRDINRISFIKDAPKITFSADKIPVIRMEDDIYTQLVSEPLDESIQSKYILKHRSKKYFSEPDALSVFLLMALSAIYIFRLKPKAGGIYRNSSIGK